MSFFTPVENSNALIRKRGVFKSAPIYMFQSVLYAKLGSSFIRLMKDQGTSVDKTYWSVIDLDPALGTLDFDKMNAVLIPYSPKIISRNRTKKVA